ncbi:unnamed protein product [Strongylus vulgaris]|uniref:Uncharacterized protein n=1 Tax=Strongylus vulgaris TaxID=40348 RepID=A0A3P7JI57_STRVU|nr:unnamed protein product [Strongylus vulgaris]
MNIFDREEIVKAIQTAKNKKNFNGDLCLRRRSTRIEYQFPVNASLSTRLRPIGLTQTNRRKSQDKGGYFGNMPRRKAGETTPIHEFAYEHHCR